MRPNNQSNDRNDDPTMGRIGRFGRRVLTLSLVLISLPVVNARAHGGEDEPLTGVGTSPITVDGATVTSTGSVNATASIAIAVLVIGTLLAVFAYNRTRDTAVDDGDDTDEKN